MARSVPASSLAPALEGLYTSFNRPESAVDPVQIVRRFTDPADIEIVGFLAAGLAFGRVASVMQSIQRVVAVMGASPSHFVRTLDPRETRAALDGFVHRWVRGIDVAALLWVLRQMIERAGSLEGFFVDGQIGRAHGLNSSH